MPIIHYKFADGHTEEIEVRKKLRRRSSSWKSTKRK